MRNKLLLSLPLLASLALAGTAAVADINDSESSGMMPATSSDDSMPHSHPMIPAAGEAKDLRNEDESDTDADATGNSAADNDTTGSSAAASIPLVSGGVGEDDLAHLKSVQNQYDLKLMITETNGTFLSDIAVHIEDKQGKTIVDTVTDGPILLVQLPTGSYKILASRHDESKAIKVSVKSGKLTAKQVTFEDTDPRVSGDPKTTQLQ